MLKQQHAPAVSSFSQHGKPIARERNVIHLGSYFIYGGQASDMQVRKCKNKTDNKPAILKLD